MSFQAMAWAINQECESSSGKIVLIMLANYADEEGYSFPSINTLARQCCVSRNTVKKWLQHWVDLGILSYEPRDSKTGRTTSHIYRLDQDGRGQPLTREGSTTDHREGSTTDPSIYKPITEEPTTDLFTDFSGKNLIIIESRFDEWWKAYECPSGRKGDKQKAKALYDKLTYNLPPEAIDLLMDRTRAYSEFISLGGNGGESRGATVWLGDGEKSGWKLDWQEDLEILRRKNNDTGNTTVTDEQGLDMFRQFGGQNDRDKSGSEIQREDFTNEIDGTSEEIIN